MPEGVFLTDRSRKIRDCNKAALREFGYQQHEIMNTEIDRLWLSKQAMDAVGHKWSRSGQSSEIIAIRKDKTTFRAVLTILADSTENEGTMTAIVQSALATDDVERRIQELQDELTRLARLYQLGDMASILAHELTQPLGAIANYSQGCSKLLDQGQNTEVQQLQDALQEITQNALRAGDIIRQLRDFMGRDCGEKRLEHLETLIGEAMKLALVGSNIAGIVTETQLGAANDVIFANRVQIEQVLVNIMRNAIEAMDSVEDARLTIATRNEADGMIVVEVSDNGPGIPHEIESSLFHPFVTTKPRGLGIGLSVSKRIVEAHGGRIAARRRGCRGSVFEIHFPLKSGQPDAK